MNGHERIAAALRGEWPDTVPIMLHNFMMAAHEAGIPMRRFRTDPHAIAESFLRAVDRYGYDGIMVDVDTATLAEAAGVPVDHPEDAPARVHGAMLGSIADAEHLEPVDISTHPRILAWLDGVQLIKEEVGDAVWVRGNADQCPYTLAGMIRGIDAWMMDLLDPKALPHIERLLAHAEGITTQFLRLMADTGADMLSNGDSPAGPDMVSPAIYRRFALPSERRMAAESHRLGLPYVLHICGNTGLILEEMVSTGADGLELDYKTDAHAVHGVLASRATLIGNIDPSGVLACGNPVSVEEATRNLLAIFADTPRFVLNAGCAIPPTTPPENLKAMIATARSFRNEAVH